MPKLFSLLGAVVISSVFSWCSATVPQSPTGAQREAVAAPIVLPTDRTSDASASTLLLAENGKSLIPIVLAANASDRSKETAGYLASKLQKITGAKFEITTGDGATGIVLGTWTQFPVASLRKPLEIRAVIEKSKIPNGEEAYAIKTEAKRVLLLGGGEAGVSHAATRFLELIGYRQFYPAPEWEIVPDLKTLKFNRDETNRPTILNRQLGFTYGYGPEDVATSENVSLPREKLSERARTDLKAWERQNRLGESFHIYNAHNYGNIIAENQQEFDAHPEYYSLIDGKRVPRTFCISNAAVRRMAVEAALRYLEKYSDETDMYSMEPGDGSAMCECDQCAALGNYSDRVFGLANEVARAISAKFPGQGKMVGLLSYNTHDIPPSFAMEPNVHVQIAHGFITGPYPFNELVRLWSQKTRNIGAYEYFSETDWGQDRLRARSSAGPTADLALLRNEITTLAARGVLSLNSENSVAWGAHGRGDYLATKLMWNPQTDVDATLHDFYTKSFGPAAATMQRYFERVDGENEQFSTTLLGLAMRDVQQASTLAKERPDVQARLSHIKQFLYYNYLEYRVLNEKDKADGKPWMFKLLQHEYRTRNTYLTHWRAISNFVAEIAKQYNEPSWNFASNEEYSESQKTGQPMRVPSWVTKENYTAEETDRNFQEALDFFKPTPLLAAAKYSEDLVPVDFGAKKTFPDFEVAEFRRGTVYLYSLKGEPFELELTGDGNKSTRDCFYALSDMAGNEFVRGTIPTDNKKHRLNLKVPRAGLYQFKVSAAGWWLYTVVAGTLNTLSLSDPQDLSGYTLNGFGNSSFFYVPKGTKQFQFFWGGAAHQFFDDEGKLIADIPASADYVTLPVPEGHDGKVWSFTGRHQPRRFVNIPNFISPWPDSLLVPRELAKKDGLKIRE